MARMSEKMETNLGRRSLPLVALLGLGAYFLSHRAKLPDLSSDNPAMQQTS